MFCFNFNIEEYPGQNGAPSNYIKVETEQNLFSLYDRAYYKEIVEAYKEYKDKGQMEISLGSFSFYDISNFAPVNLSFYQVCGNKFNYNYYLSGEFEYFGSAAKVTVTDADGKEIYKNIFSSNHYTYESTYNSYNGAVDLASGQPIKGGKTEHSYVLVESTKEEDVKCGERVAAVYVCADCGAVRDESYIKDHSACSRDNIISETLVRPEYNYCGQGVDITYKCDYCEEEITVRSYDHSQHKVNEFKTSLDTVITVYDCACGRDTSYEIDGYFEGGHSEYYYVQKQGEEERSGNYYAPYYPKDAEGDLKPIYVCWDESCTSACHYKKTMIVLEGCTYDPEAGLITYTSRSEFAIKEYESHSMPTYLWGSLKPVDETDLSKGYTYTEKCSSCGQEFAEVGLPGSTHALYISLADLGFENTRGYLYVVAEISEMYKLLTTKTALVIEYGINAYGCDFQTDWNYDSELKAYWEDNHCAVTNEDGTACGFNYSECEERIEAQLEEHVGVSYRPVLIGCDENHENAVYTLMTRYETFERHDYVEAEPVTYDTDNENIKVVVHSTKCSVCDETSYYVSVALTDDKAYTETKTVTGEDGLTYVYEAGYKPTLGIGTMYVYDGDNIVKLVSSYVRCGGGSDYRYYEIQTRTITYGYYQGIKYTVSEIYEYHYYNSDGDVSDRSYGSRYYYAHENSDKFKELFLELTGFEYNVEKYGCYTIAENTNTDGSKYYRLTEAHLAMTPSHDHLYCTQSNEYKCVVCGKTTLKSPTGHKFSYDYTTDTYKCIVCGTQSKNAYNGSIVLENLTDLETGKITIGYCIRDEYSYQYVSPAFKDLNTYIYCTVTQMNGYTMNVNNIEYVDASDENSGKFEFDLESFMAKLPDNGINPKEIASIQIYIEGYYKGQYGGTDFYESIIFSAKEFGIDTRRYFVTFTSDQLDGECEKDAVLILDPEKEFISIETEEGYRGGQLVDYNSQYFEGSFFDGYQSFRATYFDDDTGMYYLFVTSEYDEEKDEYVMHYFVEVEENPNPEEEEDEPSNPSNPSNPSQGEVSEPVSEGGQSEGGNVSEGGVSEGSVSEDGTSEGGFVIGESSEGNVAQEA